MIRINGHLEIEEDGHLITYADGIRCIRSGMNLTRKEFAEKIGLSWRTVEGWEQGITTPGLATLVYIKKMMEVENGQEKAV